MCEGHGVACDHYYIMIACDREILKQPCSDSFNTDKVTRRGTGHFVDSRKEAGVFGLAAPLAAHTCTLKPCQRSGMDTTFWGD